MKRILLVILCVLMIAGCSPDDADIDDDNGGSMMHIEGVKSLTDAFELVGKSIDELGIKKEELDSGMYIRLNVDFDGLKQDIMLTAASYRDYVIIDLWFTSHKSWDDATAYCRSLYGEPYHVYEEPYVASKGGVTFYEYYWTGKGSLEISKGEQHNFISIRYELSEKPAEIVKREEGLSFEEFAYGTGYYMDLTREDFDELKIEKTSEYQYDWDFVYQGMKAHFKLLKGDRETIENYKHNVEYVSTEYEYETVYTYVKDGYGESCWVNPFGDFWHLTIFEDATAEKLNMLRELLEKASFAKE